MRSPAAPRPASRASALLAGLGLGVGTVLLGVCGPFVDTAADAFCAPVLEIFVLGITTGTTATTYSPGENVTRLQMAAFLSRAVDRVLQRGGPRAIGDRFWTPQNAGVLAVTTVGLGPVSVACDGADVWVANNIGDSVSRVRASDGRLLETWTGATDARDILAGPLGMVFATGQSNLYEISPSQPAGAVTTVASNLGSGPGDAAHVFAFDGRRFWTANHSGSVSLVTPGPSIPWTVTTVGANFNFPSGGVFDGANVWVTDSNAGSLLKLDPAGAILQIVTVGSEPVAPVFDGANIWVPNGGTISVVRASSGAVLATLTDSSLATAAAFDGERILITSFLENHVTLWKAADLTRIGVLITANSYPQGVASDGTGFWVALSGVHQIARF